MSHHYDVAVLGLGAHGSAVAAHAAAAGLSVVGIDEGSPPHKGASHHGESRIIRAAYYEHPSYVPLIRRAYQGWDALQAMSAETIITRTGGLMMGPPNGELVPGALQSARLHGLAHEWLASEKLARRFPHFRYDGQIEAVYEPDAGVLRPEACIRAHLAMAKGHGARLVLHHRASLDVEQGANGRHLRLRGLNGESTSIQARHVVVTAGAGLIDLGLATSSDILIERQVVAHFLPAAAHVASLSTLPVFAIEEPGGGFYYGFPNLGTGVKVAEHHGGVVGEDNAVDNTVHASDIENLRAFLRRRLPAANGEVGLATVCRYSNTVDAHFVIDARDPQITVISACSGHGFKFAPTIGEIVARRLQGKEADFDLGLFAPRTATEAVENGHRDADV